MRGRLLLQELSRLKIDWDSDIPYDFQKAWKLWLCELEILTKFRVPRCFKATKEDTALELHYFADASEKSYGVAAYVRQVDRHGDVMSCSLLMSKSHVAPLKSISIPRLELCAAALAVKTNFTLERALSVPIMAVHFWTDSTTVLKYIRNVTARFQVFVANRLSIIHDGSSVQQWKYVPSAHNPADVITRGQKGEAFLDNEMWRRGPCFLWSNSLPAQPKEDSLPPTDLEFKKVSVALTTQRQPDIDPVSRLSEHYSSWTGLVRGVAWILKVKAALKVNEPRSSGRSESMRLTLQDIQNAESAIYKAVQLIAFPHDVRCLSLGEHVYKISKLSRLSPYLENGLIRVGGRLTRSNYIDRESKHPIILPSKTRTTELIIRHTHEIAGHEGRHHVLSDLRRKFWVLRANAEVRRVLNDCIACRRRLRPPESQKMADLPDERLQFRQAPFSVTGVDCFGPFYVKRGRGQLKKYGVIFTCMSIRAVHLEIIESLSTDSFICALRRFMSRRGQIRTIISDQGRNFVGAKELGAEEGTKGIAERSKSLGG
ncbi:uncharacterized protein LOC122378375 [Amphibalanus amphitrite]|uniref:uncharacterized protein LOC122378375 n=1 Tax=Amphibalanus amphitrite TaxID=1232801 RepID=UPI001C8FF474|nr:uncharacterized protein LOC122378375 [Amphibalanus amphitrite]XP_043215304.1 uncharacterized protein LOC122378375 [Amphibalanus amphitrite]XP_043215305.1 uncharacterized protein LOC122378375 [Amphibalanus amphitrite]